MWHAHIHILNVHSLLVYGQFMAHLDANLMLLHFYI